MTATYGKLMACLDQHVARYRLIDHPPEGQTHRVSVMRGHPVAQAAKCLILIVKRGKKHSHFVLVVVPGDARVSIDRLKAVCDATYVGFAAREVAEQIAGTVAGTVLPFAFDPDLDLIVDPGVLRHPEIFFNAARLDRSLALNTADYIAIARPRVERIIEG